MAEITNLAKRLKDLGIANGHAYDLANGRRTPSLKLARKIESELGVPMTAWPMPEKPRRHPASEAA